LKKKEQCRHCLVKPTRKEIGGPHRGSGVTHTLTRAQAQRVLDVLDGAIGLTSPEPENAGYVPGAGETRVERQNAVDSPIIAPMSAPKCANT
jgi:hypothetical protein